jgi:hypothetical protein
VFFLHGATMTHSQLFRYDAKADLWSVGTVLFEMVAGRPPFNGENHIDLLRNIQRKAVRLPPDVRVSKACVNLLRLLLNRNPLSRAGFKEFFEACDVLVALGCEGVETKETAGTCRIPSNDLGTIPENDGPTSTSPPTSSESLMTVATAPPQQQGTAETVTMQSNPSPVPSTTDQPSSVHPLQGADEHQQQPQQQDYHQMYPSNANIVSPPLAPAPSPAAVMIPTANLYDSRPYQPSVRTRLPPLTQSPPSSSGALHYHPHIPARVSAVPLPSFGTGGSILQQQNQHAATSNWSQQQQQYHPQQQQVPGGVMMVPSSSTGPTFVHANSVSQSQASAGDDSGFVMVEHTIGGSSRNDFPYEAQQHVNNNPTNHNMTTTLSSSSSGTGSQRRTSSSSSPTTSPHYYVTVPPPGVSALGVVRNSNNNNVMEDHTRYATKGMLSTSPGTGQMLLGMVGRAAAMGFTNHKSNNSTTTTTPSNNSDTTVKLGDDIAAAAKLIATAEDVGRRAVSVAHLGDTRAYLGMLLVFKNEEGSSLLSVTPMEEVEEEPSGGDGDNDVDDHHHRPIDNTDDSGSTEIMGPARRRSSTMSDKHMAEICQEDDQGDEMPFAISPETPAVSLPSRSNVSIYNRGNSSSSSHMKKSTGKSDPQMIQAHFAEALSCYLKALHMLKGAVGAAQKVTNDVERFHTQMGGRSNPTDYDVPKLKKRSELTSMWLLTQFRGVLERADAARVETSKLASSSSPYATYTSRASSDLTSSPPITVTCVEELIYNHALASGRDGAVKHLLGQYDAARSCYRSAGLLAETLLMEVNVGAEDRKILEGYVDGFAARITELDHLMLQQSRMVGSSNIMSSTSRRGSGIVGLIGPTSTSPPLPPPLSPPPAPPTGFLVGSPR